MIVAKLRQCKLEQVKRMVKYGPIYLFEREEQHWPLVHPLTAKFGILRDFQSFKYRLTVLTDVEEVVQHTHAHGLSKPAGAGDEGDFCRLFL